VRDKDATGRRRDPGAGHHLAGSGHLEAAKGHVVQERTGSGRQ